MSQYSYTKRPNYPNDARKGRGTRYPHTTPDGNTYPSSMGWVGPGAGDAAAIPTIMTYVTGTGVVTATITAHEFVNSSVAVHGGSHILVTNAVPAVFNGWWPVTVVDANTITYTISAGLGALVVTTFPKIYEMVEVVVAIPNLLAMYNDAIVVPTFTAAVSYSGTLNMVTGGIMTVTLTASEPVIIQGVSPTIGLTIAGVARVLTYVPASSTSTSLVFTYTAVAGDSAPTWLALHAYLVGQKFLNAGTWYTVNTAYTSGATFGAADTTNATATTPQVVVAPAAAGLVGDILSASSFVPAAVTFTTPVTTLTTVN